MELTLFTAPWLIGFIYTVYKTVLVPNHPTWPLPADAKPEVVQAERRKEHKNRLITALIFVPLVPGLGLVFPVLLRAFLTMCIWVGTGEYVQIVFNKSLNDKKVHSHVVKQFTWMERLFQVLCCSVCVAGFFGNVNLFWLVTQTCLVLLIATYIIWTTIDLRMGTQETHDFTKILEDSAKYFLGMFWIALPIGYGILLSTHNHGGGYLAILLLTSWFGDAAAYYVGKKFGSKKVTMVSPSKSWEGVYAEIGFSFFAGLAFKFLETQPWTCELFQLPHISLVSFLIITTGIGVLGVIGDLFESLVKRVGKCKDSGTYFTGHGGVLDRFDSFFLSAPLLYFYVVLCLENNPQLLTINWHALTLFAK
jgi:CDP-diglyceride synthetase